MRRGSVPSEPGQGSNVSRQWIQTRCVCGSQRHEGRPGLILDQHQQDQWEVSSVQSGRGGGVLNHRATVAAPTNRMTWS